MFQSRNRETYDSNHTLEAAKRAFGESFNLVIEKLMIPTQHPRQVSVAKHLLFQSRNRETYDSNCQVCLSQGLMVAGFNLVIEKLMIPTLWA